MRLAPLLLALAMAALTAVGCGSDSGEEGGAGGAAAEQATGSEQPSMAGDPDAPRGRYAPGDVDAPEEGERPTASRGTAIKLAGSQYGRILFDRAGQAIYLFDRETSSESQCYGECAAAWPPVLTDGEPRAAAGVDEDLLGTTERDDGATQVTYNGHPLYYYAHEEPNEVRCHNVPGFGGLWLVLDREGNPLD